MPEVIVEEMPANKRATAKITEALFPSNGANRELACAYEKTYKSLLQLKGQTFEAIDVEMQKRANSLLDFKGKFEDKT